MIKICGVSDELAPDLKDSATVARDLKIDGISLRFSGGQRFPNFSASDNDFAQSSANIKLLSATAGLWKDPWETTPQWEQEAAAARSAAAELSIPILSYFTWKAPNAEHLQNPDKLSAAMPHDVISAFQTVARENAAASIRTRLENNYAMWTGTGRTAAELIRAIGSPEVDMAWDPGSDAATRFDAGQSPETFTQHCLDEWDEIHDLVGDIHVRGIDISSGARTWCLPDRGVLDWSAILKHVLSRPRPLTFTIEHHLFDDRAAASRHVVDFLRAAESTQKRS